MQRLENLLGKENITTKKTKKKLVISINFNAFKDDEIEYKFCLDFAVSFIGKFDLKTLLKKTIDGIISEIIRYIKSYDYLIYKIKGKVYSKEALIKELEKL